MPDIEDRADHGFSAPRHEMRDLSSAIRFCSSSSMQGILAALRNGRVPAGSMPTAACSGGEP